MGPKNGANLQRQNSNSQKELSWLDRMQLKLDTLCEIDGGRNSSEGIHDTSAFFENQFSTVGTNVRKFCAEFVRELLLPEDKVEVTPNNNLQSDSALTTGGNSGAEKPVKVVDSVASGREGSNTGISGHGICARKAGPTMEPQEIVAEFQTPPVVEIMSSKPPRVPEAPRVSEAPVFFIGNEQPDQDSGASKFADEETEQYAHWFVSEEYRRMRLGKSTSTSSIQSWDGHQRAPSSDSLLEWELI